MISPRQFRLQASGTVDSAGNVTIAFSAPNVGTEWIVSVGVPGAPSYAMWQVNLGPSSSAVIQIGSMPGASSFGDLRVTEVLTLTASGLRAGQVYNAVMQGAAYEAGTAPQPVLRNPVTTVAAASSNSSAEAFVELGVSGQTSLFGPTTPGTLIKGLWVGITASALSAHGSVSINDSGSGQALWGTYLFTAPIQINVSVPLGAGGYEISGQLELTTGTGLSATGVAIAGLLY